MTNDLKQFRKIHSYSWPAYTDLTFKNRTTNSTIYTHVLVARVTVYAYFSRFPCSFWNRENLTFSDIIIFPVITFLRFIKEDSSSNIHQSKNNSTTIQNFQFTQIKNMIRSPFALFLTIVSIQQAVLGSMLTVRFRREADKDEIITISEAGKFEKILRREKF